MTDLPSGTVTFLFTDIERSTEHLAVMGNDAYADALDTHRQILREAFKSHDGHEIATEGDSFFVAFARAHDAIDAAVAGQQKLGKHLLRSRIGIHTGEALVRSEGYVGHDVHKAKRISDAGHGGQILLSQTTADLIGDKQTLVDLGPHRLKDLGEPQRIYQVGTGDFPPLRSLESFRHTLPPQRSSFIGREREIADVIDLLQHSRLVTVHGVGGCGKTRLAVQVGAEVLQEFPDGVYFADLAPIGSDDSLAHAVGAALAIPVAPGPMAGLQSATNEETVLRYVADRRCLLILDNCEHLLDACAGLVDRMLAKCPQLSILATSREALQVEGEQAWRLPSLSLPGDDAHIAASEAVSLFVARARAASSGFALTPADAPAVLEICRRLDGIPLAIEFAAARVTHLSPKQIAQKLDDRFRLLTGGRRQVQRQLTLQAALDWSYDLLDEPERVLLRRLAVFPGDFSLEAAEGICSGGAVTESSVLELLGQLVAKSLVGTEPSGDVVRYRLLETVKAYAADRLTRAEEAQTLRDRHRDWHLEWLEDMSWESIGYGAVRPLMRESIDVRAAIEWAFAEGRLDIVARMAPRMIMVSPVLGMNDDVRNWCESALGSNIELEPPVRAACLLTSTLMAASDTSRMKLREVLDMGDVVPAPLRAMALGQLGIFTGIAASFGGDSVLADDSRRDLRDALDLASDTAPDFRLAIEVQNGMNEMDLGNVEGAVAALEAAMRTQAQLPEASREAGLVAVSFHLGAALYAAGQHERAGALMLQTRALAQTLSPGVFEGGGFLGAGASVLAIADRVGTVAMLKDAVRDIGRSHMPRALEEWVSGTAGVLALAGDHQRAGRLLSWVRHRTIDRGLPSSNPATYVVDRYNVRLVREALGHEEALRCREEGRALSDDEAVELALEGLDAL